MYSAAVANVTPRRPPARTAPPFFRRPAATNKLFEQRTRSFWCPLYLQREVTSHLCPRFKGAKNNKVGQGEIDSKAPHDREKFSSDYVGVVGKNNERGC